MRKRADYRDIENCEYEAPDPERALTNVFKKSREKELKKIISHVSGLGNLKVTSITSKLIRTGKY